MYTSLYKQCSFKLTENNYIKFPLVSSSFYELTCTISFWHLFIPMHELHKNNIEYTLILKRSYHTWSWLNNNFLTPNDVLVSTASPNRYTFTTCFIWIITMPPLFWCGPPKDADINLLWHQKQNSMPRSHYI